MSDNTGFVVVSNKSEDTKKLDMKPLGNLNLFNRKFMDIVGMAIAGSNDHCYAWYKDGTVSSGTSLYLDKYRTSYKYTLPAGKTPSDIVGMAIAGSNDHCYAWYKDGTVSSGTSSDLDKYRTSYKYTLPTGKTPSDIVGMAIAGSNDHCYAWYKDGTVSSGTSSDLDKYRTSYKYTLPAGKTPSDIIGMAIAGSNDHCYAWYKDGTVSSGTSSDLDKYFIRLLLNSNEIISLLKDKLSDKLSENCQFLFPDKTYYCSPRSDIDRLISSSSTDRLRWISEKHDCDDFALSLKCDFVKDAYSNGVRRYPHSLGILWGQSLKEGKHAINVVITSEKEVLFIEPQNDSIFPPRKEDDKIRFIYF